MAKKDFKELATRILELVGGEDNVTYLTHCITRLRFNVKVKSLVKEDEIKALNGVAGLQWAADQLQIIIGTDVEDAYLAICNISKLGSNEVKETDLEKSTIKKNPLTSFFEILSGCLVPVLPILIGTGMIKVLLIILTMTGILKADSSTYTVLSFVADSGFYFLPVFVGATAAKKFNTNMMLGMVVGAIFIHPNFVSLVNEGTSLNIFGLPVTNVSYASTVFPTILSIWAMSHVERIVSKYSPKVLSSLLVPLLTLLIMTPIALCVLGPLGGLLGNYLAIAIEWLYSTLGFLGVAVLSAIFPFVIMTGMHHAFSPYVIASLSTLKYEPIVGFANYVSNFCMGAACLGVAIKSKNKEKKAESISCATTVLLGGISEPGLYGVILPNKHAMISMIVGSFSGGVLAGLLKVYLYQFSGNASLFGLAAFMGKNSSNIIFACISIALGFAISFIMTLIIYKEEKKG